MLLDNISLVMSLDASLFYSFGDVIGGEQIWGVSINLQSNKVIVFGQISQFQNILSLLQRLQNIS
jgi:hypothetical protein